MTTQKFNEMVQHDIDYYVEQAIKKYKEECAKRGLNDNGDI